MRDVLIMQVVQAGRHLTKPQSRLLFRHDAVVLHKIKQIAVVGVAHEDEDARATLQNAMHLRPIQDADISHELSKDGFPVSYLNDMRIFYLR